jgi:hypothetical protein
VFDDEGKDASSKDDKTEAENQSEKNNFASLSGVAEKITQHYIR